MTSSKKPVDLRRAGLISSLLGVVFIAVMAAAILWLGKAVLTEPKKTLVVLATPPGVEVRIDGEVQQGNPRLVPGTHKVEIRRQGQAPLVQDVELEPGSSVTLTLDAQGKVKATKL